MDAVQAENLGQARFLPERIFAAVEATQVLVKMAQATLLFAFWANMQKYEETIVDFQALLLVTDLYRVTLDKRNSIFLLCFFVLVLHMVNNKYFFASVLAMTVSSILCESVDMFYFYMVMKTFGDVALYILTGKNVLLLRTHLSSRFTDFLWLLFTILYHLKYSIENYRTNTVVDLLLVPIFLFHMYVFCMKLYTWTNFCYAIDVTLFWMHLKSATHPRRLNLLRENINAIFG